jgi:hypothetical protein
VLLLLLLTVYIAGRDTSCTALLATDAHSISMLHMLLCWYRVIMLAAAAALLHAAGKFSCYTCYLWPHGTTVYEQLLGLTHTPVKSCQLRLESYDRSTTAAAAAAVVPSSAATQASAVMTAGWPRLVPLCSHLAAWQHGPLSPPQRQVVEPQSRQTGSCPGWCCCICCLLTACPSSICL